MSDADDKSHIDEQLRELERRVSAEFSKLDRKLEKQREKSRTRGSFGRNARRAVAWTAAVALIGGGSWFAYQKGVFRSSGASGGLVNDTSAVTNGPVPTATASSPSSAAASPASPSAASPAVASGPPADPFATSPADSWADGAAGVTVPAAAAHGTFSASTVASSYQTARKILIAQNLDPATLAGGAPTAFADTLTATQRSNFLKDLDKVGLNKDGTTTSTRAWVLSFAPRTTDLIGKVIKARGSMSAAAATEQGQPILDVHVNYIFVYAVEPPGHPGDWMRVVDHVDGIIQFDRFDAAGTLEPWVYSAFPTAAGGNCAMPDGYVHPDYPASVPASAQPAPTGPAVNPYNFSQSNTTSTCQATTGT